MVQISGSNELSYMANGNAEAHIDATALRMLNLLFTLHVSPVPLTTDQILGDADMGYGSGNIDSDRRKFLRDRARLEECGIVIREVTADGASEREESSWAIDRTKTHARSGILEREDAEAVLTAVDEHFALHGDDPVRWPLQRARAKLATLVESATEPPLLDAPSLENTTLRHVWNAFKGRRAARFTYRDAQGNKRDREVEVYAFFTQGCHTYLVGRCRETDRVRTFRTDRIVSARKSPASGHAYHIPHDFAVQRYQFLPFDFLGDMPAPATFSFPGSLSAYELELLTHRRGALRKSGEDSRWIWEIEVSDLEGAASFALEHASRGMRAESPDELVALTHELANKAVSVHGA